MNNFAIPHCVQYVFLYFNQGDMCAANIVSGSSIILTAGDLSSSAPDTHCACGLDMPDTGVLMVNVEATAIGVCNEVLSLFAQLERRTMICENKTFSYNLTQDRPEIIQLALQNATLRASDGSFRIELSLSGKPRRLQALINTITEML